MNLKEYGESLFAIIMGIVIQGLLVDYLKVDILWIGTITLCVLILIISWCTSWLQNRTNKVKKNTREIKSILSRICEIEKKQNISDMLHQHDTEIALINERLKKERK